jgi:hypothetical protein
VHKAPDGERHIADVKTDRGWVIEFQHSHIKPEERQSRDDFYKPLVWVVDGKTRIRDQAQFYSVVTAGEQLGAGLIKTYTKGSALLRDWETSKWPVFFDFGLDDGLWWHVKGAPDAPSYFLKLSHSDFVQFHRNSAADGIDVFNFFRQQLLLRVSKHETPPSTQPQVQSQDLREQMLRGYRPTRRRF